MSVRAYLKGDKESIPITAEITTIGREDCDIILNDCHLDRQHAIVEFCQYNNRPVIYDLNTVSGTYVNGCRIQNSAVQIVNGDVIQFGYNGKSLRFAVNNAFISSTCKTLFPENLNHPSIQSHSNGGGAGLSPDLSKKSSYVTTLPALNTNNSSNSVLDKLPSVSMKETLLEKERKLIQMGDEINRLSAYEKESRYKDKIIASLRQRCQNQPPKLPDTTTSIDDASFAPINHSCSPTLMAQLANSDKKLQELREEIRVLKRNYECSQGLVQSLQKELATKETSSKKNQSQIESLKQQLRLSEQKVSALSSKCTQLSQDASKTELNDKLVSEVKELKAKWKAQEHRLRSQVDILQSYKDELAKMKQQNQTLSHDNNLISKEITEAKQKFLELHRSEKLLKVEYEQTKSHYSQFRLKVVCALNSADLDDALDENGESDGFVLNTLQKVIKDRFNLRQRIASLQKDLQNSQLSEEDILKAKQALEEEIRKILGDANKSKHTVQLLQDKLLSLKSLVVDDNYKWITDIVSSYLESELEFLMDIDSTLISVEVVPNTHEKTVCDHLKELHCKLIEEKNACSSALATIDMLKEEHAKELEIQKEKMDEEHLLNIKSLTERLQSDGKDEAENLLKIKLDALNEKHKLALADEAKKLDSANEEIEKLCVLLNEKKAELDSLQSELELAQSGEGELKIKIDEQEKEIDALKKSHESDIAQLNGRLNKSETDSADMIAQLKEEVHQHAITIVSMEKKLQEYKLVKKELDARGDKRHNYSQTVEKVSNQAQEKIVMLEEQNHALQSEISLARQHIVVLDDTILGLRNDLKGAESRLSDMTGELSETLKEELEYNRNLVRDQKVDICRLQEQLKEMTALSDHKQDLVSRLESDVKSAELALENEKVKNAHNQATANSPPPVVDNTPPAATEEPAVEPESNKDKCSEPKCHGERHAEIIMRQREALAELRAHVKALEQVQPPLPSQEQALQQVVLLKKELAEIRAKQALDEDQELRKQIMSQDSSYDTEKQLHTATTTTSLERSSREQLAETMIASEKTYIDLVTSLKGILNISHLSGIRSMSHTPKDEREKLSADRKIDLDLISNYVKSLIQRVEQKERLLQDYEKDLCKLREAEEFSAKNTMTLNSLRNKLIDKVDEVNNLRKVLIETRDALESEERINVTLKKRLANHIRFVMGPTTSPSPPPKSDESYAKAKKTKRNMEIKKRRQYELETLRKFAESQEKDLCEATAKIINLETNKRVK